MGSLAPGSQFNQGWLYYREGATADYDTVMMAGADAAATVEIPGTVMGDRGVEYWLEVHTLSTVLTDPATNPSASPHGLQTTLSNLEETQSISTSDTFQSNL